jgi:hypothetical protein
MGEHVAVKDLRKIKSPLDMILGDDKKNETKSEFLYIGAAGFVLDVLRSLRCT